MHELDRPGPQEPLGLGDEFDDGSDRVAGSPVQLSQMPQSSVDGVVEQVGDVAHPAVGGVEVVDHRLLFEPAGGGDRVDPAGRVRPRLQRALVAGAGDPFEHAVDVELLDDELEHADLDVDLAPGSA